MRILSSLLFSLLVISGYAGNQEIIESSIRFDIKNAGVTVEGSFSGLTGSINFDPNDHAKSKVELSLPSNSIQTGISSRDNHLKKEEYLDAGQFPSIQMKSKFFGKAATDGAFRGYFTLTLKGVSQEITLPFTCVKEGDHYRIKGDFTLNRRDFGVGGKSLIMGDEVNVHINLLVTQDSKSQKPGTSFPLAPHQSSITTFLPCIPPKP